MQDLINESDYVRKDKNLVRRFINNGYPKGKGHSIDVDKDFWKIVELIGWGTYSTDDKTIRIQLAKIFTHKQIDRLSKIARNYRLKLMSEVYSRDDGDNLIGMDRSDDGMWDWGAHIVGMGKETYDAATKDPLSFKDVDDEENFEYCFNLDT